MTLAASAAFSGTLDPEDRRAALLAILNWNNSHPDRQLPLSTNAEIRQSYLTIMSETVASVHASNVQSSKSVSAATAAGLTDAQRDEILGAVIDRMLAKESFDTILTDVKSPS